MNTRRFILFFICFGIILLLISGCSDKSVVGPNDSKNDVTLKISSPSSTAISVPNSVAAPTTPVQVDATTPLYRYWNPKGDHLYTIDWNELRWGASGYGFERVEGNVLPLGTYTGRNDLSPVYRLWCGGSIDHLYTTSYNEAQYAMSIGYVFEKIGFYIYTTQKPGTIPLYRFYWAQATDHFYTTDINEGMTVGATLEGTLGYVFPAD